MKKTYQTLADFYPYYLTEHRNATSRRLHFIGTGLFISLLIYALFMSKWTLLTVVPLVGYGFAWVGHFFFERNKPATFKYPLFSLMSDFIMFWDILTGQIDRKLRDAVNTTNWLSSVYQIWQLSDKLSNLDKATINSSSNHVNKYFSKRIFNNTKTLPIA